MAIVLCLFTLGFERLLLDLPSAWFLVHPSANSHFVNRPGSQFFQRNLIVSRFHRVLPFGEFAIDAFAQLNVVKELGVARRLRLGPADHGGVFTNFAHLDFARLPDCQGIIAALVRLTVLLGGLLGMECLLPNLPVARLVAEPATHADIVRCVRAEPINVNAPLGRLCLVTPFADFPLGPFADLYLVNHFSIKLAEQTPTDLRNFV